LSAAGINELGESETRLIFATPLTFHNDDHKSFDRLRLVEKRKIAIQTTNA